MINFLRNSCFVHFLEQENGGRHEHRGDQFLAGKERVGRDAHYYLDGNQPNNDPLQPGGVAVSHLVK